MNGTIRLPALVANEVFEVSGEGLDRQISVGGKSFVVRIVDGDDIAVRREQVPAVQLLDPVGSFLLKRSLHLLRHHAAAEHPGERVADGSLEFPFETLNYPHRNLLTVPGCRGLLSSVCGGCGETRSCPGTAARVYHGTFIAAGHDTGLRLCMISVFPRTGGVVAFRRPDL